MVVTMRESDYHFGFSDESYTTSKKQGKKNKKSMKSGKKVRTMTVHNQSNLKQHFVRRMNQFARDMNITNEQCMHWRGSISKGQAKGVVYGRRNKTMKRISNIYKQNDMHSGVKNMEQMKLIIFEQIENESKSFFSYLQRVGNLLRKLEKYKEETGADTLPYNIVYYMSGNK